MRMTVDILVLGAGWTSTFVKELCETQKLTYAATSQSGRDDTIKFAFDPDSDDFEPYTVLPLARTVLITFPITKKGASPRLVRLYFESHGEVNGLGKTRFVQLGTTSIWDGKRSKADTPGLSESQWYDRHSPFVCNPRAEAEEELLALSSTFPSTILNLSGLWGGARSPKNWVGKVVPSKEVLRDKGSIHLIHGMDVARAVLAVHHDFDKAQGQRWILSDGRVYDWWDLASAWGTKRNQPSDITSSDMEDNRGPQAEWVRELMDEAVIRALPRSIELLGRALDSRDFWKTFNLSPIHARIEECI